MPSNTNYPGALDSPTNPTAANPTTNPAHHLQHGLENDAIVALETALGITAAPGPLHYDMNAWYRGPAGGTAGYCLGESIPRWALNSVALASLASGTVFMQSMYLPKGVTVTQLGFVTGSTAASTPTHQWMGLYDNALNQLAVTADGTTTAIPANTKSQRAIATIASGASSSFVTTYSGLYYVGLMVAATAPPTLMGGANVVNATTIDQVPPIYNGPSDTGQTTIPTFPHQATALSTSLGATPYIWVA